VYVNIYIILDDYVTARRNLPLAELTSDFPSECEEKIVGKRQHKKKIKNILQNHHCQVAQIYLRTKKMTPVLSKNLIILSCRYHRNFNKNQNKF